ncbi:unnamed protein product [Effrenium voratum]|uniref:Uncharacterized protein n=1 Tax=Effrenium voratum TaxID=2562239 RepID=A0AA36JI50_9DINO|nr:unnamed protein product [Effrenium voratum]CAJ1405433.1 unnamed protein product [Effrenium voratum]CAJ1430647.1 unnamed protein product [Effrenium voratum]|mmetsp:Transcript_80153/g.192257  ORF Transcript_80153/g.192257 Transcript_80153/m.192257 type:complete len:181 (+) Transcript_80153:60-602(+)
MMANFGHCRFCTENPFNVLFGKKPEDKDRTRPVPKTKASRRNEKNFNKRSEEEVQEMIKSWDKYVHDRARDFFAGTEQLHQVLGQLAQGTDKNADPVMGNAEECVYWYGDVTKDERQAAIRMIKPGEQQESITYVNRVLAFMFATDDSFEKLMQLPKEPFRMTCGDQLCVHLAHISVATC